MDTRFVLQGVTFIRDENKPRENPRHHDGVTCEQAAEAFFDPFLKVVDASRNEEARDAILGMDTRWHPLFVVHIEPGEDAIRLISARQATRKERDDYAT